MTGRLLSIAMLLLGCMAPWLSQAAEKDLWNSDETASQPAEAGNADVAVSPSDWQPASVVNGSCCCCCDPHAGWYAGADARALRTHFSEAIAFATLAPGPAGLRVNGSELNFDYRGAFAVFAGYHLNEYSDVRFTFQHIDTTTGVAATAAPGTIIVDGFGNTAFGAGFIPGRGSDSINTVASVRLNVYDLEYLRRMEDLSWPTSVTYSAGLRFADTRQFYDSQIRDAGNALMADGLFRVNWFGVGPYGSITGRVYNSTRRVSAFAKAGGALLVGQNNISTNVFLSGANPGNPLNPPGFPLAASQTSGRILVVPVLESEIGASWQPNDRLRISAGYLVQAWMDLGVSGGTFSGQQIGHALGVFPGGPFPAIQNVFGGADDSSIMAFEGFFARLELNY